MKTRELVAIVVIVLVGSLIVFWPKGEDDNDGAAFPDRGARSEDTSQSADSGGELETSERRTRSKRVLKEKPEKVTTSSGLQYEVLAEGEGDHPGPTSTVKVHYVGTFEDGKVFDSSRERGQPAVFPLNRVIKGWTEGLQLMKPGGITRFTIPADLAYGDTDRPKIPGGSTLIFEVELLSIEKP